MILLYGNHCEHIKNSKVVFTKIGDEFWYDDWNKLHNDDLPAIIWHNGIKEYYQHGKQHRLGGPALIFSNGDCQYYQNDKLHRLDGPAVDYMYVKEWWINGRQIDCQNNEEFLRVVKMKELL